MSKLEVITLNVGGVIYQTTLSTICKYEDSMIGVMFNGHHNPTIKDQNGNYFIDRDGCMFRHILNFLRTGQLSLPNDFKDFNLLELEADFYQIPDLNCAIKSLQKEKLSTSSSLVQKGLYVELLDCEETAYFYRFYSDPPRGINTELKNSGIVISGAKKALLMLPLPEKVLKDVQSAESIYRTVTVNSSSCPKMSLIHFLKDNGWQLVTTSFTNTTNSEGSYMIHKYIWYLQLT